MTRDHGPAGKAFLYRAVARPKRAHRRLVRNLLDRVFDGDGVALVAALFESRPPNEEQIRELEKLLKDLREDSSRKARKTARREP